MINLPDFMKPRGPVEFSFIGEETGDNADQEKPADADRAFLGSTDTKKDPEKQIKTGQKKPVKRDQEPDGIERLKARDAAADRAEQAAREAYAWATGNREASQAARSELLKQARDGATLAEMLQGAADIIELMTGDKGFSGTLKQAAKARQTSGCEAATIETFCRANCEETAQLTAEYEAESNPEYKTEIAEMLRELKTRRVLLEDLREAAGQRGKE